jgi:hypothetical protein
MKSEKFPPVPSASSAEKFYRQLLEQIASENRKTRGRRLAESGLTFWDSMQREKLKPKP